MMLITRCSGCGKVFRVHEYQLLARDGRVRCGACNTVFDAYKTLREVPEGAPVRAPAAAVPLAPEAPPAPAPAPALEVPGEAPQPEHAAPGIPAFPAAVPEVPSETSGAATDWQETARSSTAELPEPPGEPSIPETISAEAATASTMDVADTPIEAPTAETVFHEASVWPPETPGEFPAAEGGAPEAPQPVAALADVPLEPAEAEAIEPPSAPAVATETLWGEDLVESPTAAESTRQSSDILPASTPVDLLGDLEFIRERPWHAPEPAPEAALRDELARYDEPAAAEIPTTDARELDRNYRWPPIAAPFLEPPERERADDRPERYQDTDLPTVDIAESHVIERGAAGFHRWEAAPEVAHEPTPIPSPEPAAPIPVPSEPSRRRRKRRSAADQRFDFGPARLSRRARWLWGSGSTLLALVLLGQGIFIFRNEIGAWLPVSRPWLAQACAALGCEVTLPRNGDLLVIGSTDLERASNGVLTFTTVIQNRARYSQALPNLALTLKDERDQPVARRILTPRDYLSAVALGTATAAGIPGGGEVVARASIAAASVGATGYEVLVFYP